MPVVKYLLRLGLRRRPQPPTSASIGGSVMCRNRNKRHHRARNSSSRVISRIEASSTRGAAARPCREGIASSWYLRGACATPRRQRQHAPSRRSRPKAMLLVGMNPARGARSPSSRPARGHHACCRPRKRANARRAARGHINRQRRLGMARRAGAERPAAAARGQHGEADAARGFLKSSKYFLALCGLYLQSTRQYHRAEIDNPTSCRQCVTDRAAARPASMQKRRHATCW